MLRMARIFITIAASIAAVQLAKSQQVDNLTPAGSDVQEGGKCECNGVIGTDKGGITVGQCKYRYIFYGYFCFIEEDSQCLDKATTDADYNPRNEESMKFRSTMACYPLQVIDGEAKCPGGSTICGDSCIPPGQYASNDHHVYCCTSNNTSQVMQMDQVCGTSCHVDSYGLRRSLCGTTSPACIYSAMEGGGWSNDYCCNGKVIDIGEKCDGCDYTSLKCNPDNSTQCLHRHKWCDGVRDCLYGEDEVETNCRSNDLLQRACGRQDAVDTGPALSLFLGRVGQCFVSSPLVAGHRCIDRKDKVANISLAISTPSPPLLHFCSEYNAPGVKCGVKCMSYKHWCGGKNDICTADNNTIKKKRC